MTIIVLDGNENQAVAAVRSLASAGHDVVVGAETSWSKAGWSRGCRSTFTYPSPEHDVPGFLHSVVSVLLWAGGAVVLPMTERSLLPLSKERARVQAAGGRLVLPDHERVLQACSKPSTSALARQLEIAVPATVTLGGDPVEARRMSSELLYPVVLKPAMSHEAGGQQVRSTGAPQYASNAREFVESWRVLMQRCATMLVQPFIPGGGTGYFALVRHGEVLADFAHRRIRDVRPTGSGSAVRESIAMTDRLREPSRRLLRALAWHGVAMIEYRERPDGDLVFLEVNGRFWNSLPLAVAAGVDFPRLLVELESTGDVTAQAPYRVGVRCRWWLGDTRHLLQVWHGPPRGYPMPFPGRLSTLRAFLTPRRGTVHDNFTWSDPAPELGDWLHFFGRQLPGALRRRTDVRVHDVEGRAAHS
jgi:predicted ATP-grasp superfamily ATP-dependent carboligase